MFPQFSVFWNHTYSILVTFMLIILFLFVISWISSMTNYFGSKKEKLQKEKEKKIDRNKSIEYSEAILDTISLMARTEILAKIQSLGLINTQYEIKNMDNDIKEISTTIFEGIKPDTYKNNECIFESEYLFRFIYKVVSMTLMDEMTALNSKIRENNNMN